MFWHDGNINIDVFLTDDKNAIYVMIGVKLFFFF